MPDSLAIQITNNTSSSNAFAYVTGLLLSGPSTGKRGLLQSNGRDVYIPDEVSAIGTALSQDCAIPLGSPGNVTNITIPQLAGGRLWISVDAQLTFLLNPGGPALVEPSVLNPSDPNYNVNFAFAEFTLNNDQFYGNISYVDFVPRVPVALELDTASGQTQTVSGMPASGLQDVTQQLAQQAASDGRPWDRLTVNGADGQPLRVLNATHGNAVGASFDGYFEPYVDQVWQKYQSATTQINTQSGSGVLSGSVGADGMLTLGGEQFSKPNTNDILGCNSGPFTTGPSPLRNAIIPRLAAAFVRTTFLDDPDQPTAADTYYKTPVTQHYARVVHAVNIDQKGYAFAYDDVTPDGAPDVSGKVNAGDPTMLKVTIGGPSSGSGGGTVAFPAGGQGQQGVLRDGQALGDQGTNAQTQPRRQSGLKGLTGKFRRLF